MARSLFRPEALDAQREKFLGEIIAIRPMSLWAFVVLAVSAATILIAVSVWGQYQRRERVQGYLASEIGNVPLLISDAGEVTKVLVHEGQSVTAGQAVAQVSIDRTTNGASSSSGAVLYELARQRELLVGERDATLELSERQIAQVHRRIDDLNREINEAKAQYKLQGDRLKSAQDQLKRYEQLYGQKFISEAQLQQKRDEATDQSIKLQSLNREIAALQKDYESAQLEEPTISLATDAKVKQIVRQISDLTRLAAEESQLRATAIVAPIAGTVTNIAVSEGQTVAANTPLATIVPKSGLHCELLVPTRAIGFVRPGQHVQLRYEAFPYERFGQYGGVVKDVSSTVWMQGERVGPLSLHEPAYRITVELDRQTVQSGSQEVALRSGMLVSADLLMEKRTLLEWLFQPVLQLRERMR